MMFSKGKVFALCLALLPAAAQSATVELTKDADWTEFRFDITRESGAWLETNDNLGILSFTFSLTKSAYLQVSDGYRSGDQFEVFSNGRSLGFTSTPTAVGDEAGNDFNTAKMDARWSSGEWLLGPGDYAITGFVRLMPEMFGRGAIRVASAAPVPLPATLPLLLGAGAVLGFASRRRKCAIGGQAR